jgi:uncharacterized membrane protein YsdA (DUF1294 family)
MLWIPYFIIINTATFFLFGADKQRAKKHRWRIPERVLLGCSLLGGALGGCLGMMTFRHKTKHLSFRICLPLFLILDAVAFGLLLYHVYIAA